MIRKFGYDDIYRFAGEGDEKKVLVGIRRKKERAKKKKAAGDGDDEEEGVSLFFFLSHSRSHEGCRYYSHPSRNMESWLTIRQRRHHQETPSMISSTIPTQTLNPKTTSQNNQVQMQPVEKVLNLLNHLNSNPEKVLLYRKKRRRGNLKIRLVILGMKGMNLWICYLGVLLVGLLVSFSFHLCLLALFPPFSSFLSRLWFFTSSLLVGGEVVGERGGLRISPKLD
jgi:hypothetical protein